MKEVINFIKFEINRETKVPVYQQIAAYLEQEIRFGNFNADMEFPDERTLSAKLSVNRRTLRKALEKLVYSGMIYKIHGKGIYIRDLRPQAELSALELSHRSTVMIAMPETIEHHREILVRNGAVEYFHEHGFEVISTTCIGKDDEYNRVHRRREILQGVLFHRWTGHIWQDSIDWVKSYGLPVVVCGVDGGKFNVDFSGVNVSRAMEKATEYFIGRKFRNIVFVAQNVPLCLGSERGYVQTMEAAGLEAVVLGRYANPPVLLSARTDLNVVLQAYHETKRYFSGSKRVDAVIAESSCCAVGVLNALKELNIDVPRDVELIAFGEDPVADVHFAPEVSPISVAAIPYRSIGIKAAELLVRRIEKNDAPVEKTEFEVQLVFKQTTENN